MGDLFPFQVKKSIIDLVTVSNAISMGRQTCLEITATSGVLNFPYISLYSQLVCREDITDKCTENSKRDWMFSNTATFLNIFLQYPLPSA